MEFITVVLLALGLSMDAFAVSICKGLSMTKADAGKCCIVGAWFGAFQALMPYIGFMLGSLFLDKIEKFDHWIAFILLAIIGINMIVESRHKEEEADEKNASLAFGTMLVLSIATSIDALASGVALACDGTSNIYVAIAIIGTVTFVMSFTGVKIGNVFGSRYKSSAELIGGIILVGLGIKTLISHLF